ncbi:MAG: molybdopterin molybdenumtransferase MoeA, partial [Promethearchaeota archaeon]
MKFLKTIRVDEFKKILDSISSWKKEEELININNCFNRVISRDVESKINVPHFRKSRMDGYAVRVKDTFGAEEDNIIKLELIETIQAGDIPTKILDEGKCAYVATGAAIPEGADGVVMVEFTESNDNEIFISRAVTPGTYIIDIGHDVKMGDSIVKKGTSIDLATIGMLASCGIKDVWVYLQPIVSL